MWAVAATRGSNGKDMLVTAGGNAVTVHYSHKTRTRTNVRLLYGNYYTNDNAGDVSPNVTLTVAAAIIVGGTRYPAFSPLGATTITIPPGARDVPLDVAVVLPPDTQFTVHTWVSTSNPSLGIPWTHQQNSPPEVNDYAGSNPGDKTRSGGITAGGISNVGSSLYGPGALVSIDAERGASVALMGDSNAEGVGDGAFHRGWVQRGLGNDVPWVVLSRGGERVQTMASNARFRIATAVASGCTHLVLVAGTNDAQGSRTLEQLQADATTTFRAARAAGMRVIGTKVLPLTDGSFGSDGAQTIRAQWLPNGLIDVYNSWLDAQVASGLLAAVWDPRPFIRSSTDSNKWAPGMTGDGIHLTSTGAEAAKAAVNRAILVPPAPAAGALLTPNAGNTLGTFDGVLRGYQGGSEVFFDPATVFGSVDAASTPALPTGSIGSGLQFAVFNPDTSANAPTFLRVALGDLPLGSGSGGGTGTSGGGGSGGAALDTDGLLAYYRPGASRATLDAANYSGNPSVPGGRVMLLDDLTGNSRPLIEETPELAPVLVAPDGSGSAAARFVGSAFQRLTNLAGQTYMALNTSDVTYAVAFRTPATLGSGNNMVMWIGRNAADDGKMVIATTFSTPVGLTVAFGRLGPSGGGVIEHSVAVQPNTKYIVIARSSYGSRALDLTVNGIHAATVTATEFGLAPDWDRHMLGAERYASDNFSGDVFEARLYSTYKSTVARDALYQDLLSRHGV